MQKPRRRKILLSLASFIVLLFIVGYVFRYPLIMQLQYYRLRSLHCTGGTENSKSSCLQRIWVHRVNSTERYNQLKNKYAGFEMDIVFDDSTRSFSVYHPPKRPEKDTLLLDNFLKHLDLGHKHFWLDTRLVNGSNMNEALSEMSRLDQRYGIKTACIIELYDVAAAALFAGNGYTVGLNLTESLQALLVNDSLLKDSIDKKLESVRYISRDAQALAPVKKLFPQKQIITWRLPFRDFFDPEPIQALLDDPQIDIVLLNIKSPFQDK
jgi:hypothetical protein